MSTVSISKASRQNRLLKIIAGIDKHFANVTTITLGDVDRTPAEIKALIQSDIDASNASLQVRQQLRAVVQVERNSHAKLDPTLRLLKAFVIAKFGETNDASPKLGDFGFTPRKSTKKTVAAKTVALGKNKATRSARHTLGRKQKAQIKGTTPATNVSGSPPNTGAAPGGTPTSKPS